MPPTTPPTMPQFTLHFKAYNYMQATTLAQAGWKLITYAEVAAYKDLLLADYVQDGGMEMMGSWASSGCCITVAGGYRLTANGASFVYPLNAAGTAMKCPAAGQTTTYESQQKYILAFHQGGRFHDLSSVTSLYAGHGKGLCASKPGEGNPGIYVGKAKRASPNSKHCQIIGGQNLCIGAPP
jgi:hypothetical protein